jgi:hypothetical protein
MKLIFKLILLPLSLQATAAKAETITHRVQPLEEAVLYLTKLSSEAEKLNSPQNERLIGELKSQISELTRRSLLTTFAPLDKNYKDEGYVLTPTGTNSWNRQFRVSRSTVHERLKREAFDLIKQSWVGVNMTNQADHFNTKSLLQLAEKAASALYPVDMENIKAIAEARHIATNQINVEAQDTLNCISFFSKATPQMGLVAVPVTASGDLAWSQPDLFRVYQVSSMDDLFQNNQIQKRMAVIRNLETLLDAWTINGPRCVHQRVANFWTHEAYKLRGNN